jgi:hypothetical protein
MLPTSAHGRRLPTLKKRQKNDGENFFPGGVRGIIIWMLPRRPQRARSASSVAVLLCALVPATVSGDGGAGYAGVLVGYAYHGGQTAIVDASSGATRTENEDVFHRQTFTGGLAIGFGFPAGPGNVGIRLTGRASAPGPLFGVAAMPRYRLEIELDGDPFLSVEPWLGAGLGAYYKEKLHRPYLGFPLFAGCDLQVDENLFVTSQLEIMMINPWGPSWTEHRGASHLRLDAHHNSIAFELGLAYRFR